MEKLLFKLKGVFAISAATAGSLATLIIAAFNKGTLTLGKAAALVAGMGVAGVAFATVALVSYFVLRDKIKRGKKALTAW
ncbi:MAG: hypothetical protein ABS890_04735 [Carnobacterium inhibens]|uniref:hypothetical protein n=1 Tax=Carnobacterium inhibens TaxID=147709 RepID=UPI0033155C04